jgi:O-antigen/teichoic acid export membrane protein
MSATAREAVTAQASAASSPDIGGILLRNTAWNYLGFAGNLFTNILIFPYVVRGLGDSPAGIWLLLSSVTGYMGLLELGIVPSLTQIVASSLATGDRERVNRSASTALAILILISIVPLVGTLFVPLLVGILAIPADLQAQTRWVFSIAIVGFALRMPLAAFQALLLGTQRQDRCNQLWILIGISKGVAAIVVISSGAGLVALVTAEALIHLIAGVFQWRWIHGELPYLRLSWRLANREDARKVITFGGMLLVLTVSSLLIEQTDRFVVAAFLPVAMVTYYSAGWKVYVLAFQITTTLVQAVSPMAADLHGRGDSQAVRDLFLRMTKYSVAIAWPLVFALALCSTFILRVWMGQRYVSASVVVVILAGAFAVTAHNHVGHSVLIGTRRVGPMVWRYHVPQALLNLVLSLWLVRTLGIAGVALGTFIPAVVFEYTFLRFVLHEIGISWKQFAHAVVLPTIVPAWLSFSLLILTYAWFDHASFIQPAAATFCGILYCFLFWRRSLSDSERDQFWLRTRQILGPRFDSMLSTAE